MATDYSATRGRFGVLIVAALVVGVVLWVHGDREGARVPREGLGAVVVAAAAVPWLRGAVVARPLEADDASPLAELGWFAVGAAFVAAGLALYAG